MAVLHIENPVANFDAWRQAFDRDPIDRAGMGVRRDRIMHPVDDERYVIVHLEFDTEAEANISLDALRGLWSQVQGSLIMEPTVRILRVVEDGTP